MPPGGASVGVARPVLTCAGANRLSDRANGTVNAGRCDARRLAEPAGLLGVVLWGAIAGSMLPFILRRFGFDPASASAPFVATLVDVSGLVIDFSTAAIILRGTLL